MVEKRIEEMTQGEKIWTLSWTLLITVSIPLLMVLLIGPMVQEEDYPDVMIRGLFVITPWISSVLIVVGGGVYIFQLAKSIIKEKRDKEKEELNRIKREVRSKSAFENGEIQIFIKTEHEENTILPDFVSEIEEIFDVDIVKHFSWSEINARIQVILKNETTTESIKCPFCEVEVADETFLHCPLCGKWIAKVQ